MELNFVAALIKHDVNHNVRECFKSSRTFVSRKEEVMAIKNKFPSKIPLLLEKYHKEKSLPTLEKKKFLVPGDITMSQFLVVVRKKMKLKPNQAIYLMINNKSMLSMTLTMSQAYQSYCDEDGFLYVTYASQEVFGYQDEVLAKKIKWNIQGDETLYKYLLNEWPMIGEKQELEAIKHRFPNKVPLFVERYVNDREVPALSRKKFLVPRELTLSQFLYLIRSKMKLRDSQALYLLVNNKVLMSNSMTMAQAYEMFRHDDGYLHITYAAQQVFG